MSILIFLLVLFVLVLVHELGHFIAAKRTGMRVDEFGIGFPPKLFGVRKGETEYTFNLLPIGGFVKIFGEDAIGTEGDHNINRSFVSKNKWAQSVVLIAGVTMNILFAWLLFSMALSIGVQTIVDSETTSNTAELMITDILPGSPAERVGLPRGSVILDVTSGNERIDALTPAAFSGFTEEHNGGELAIAYELNGELFVVPIAPETGIIDGDNDRAAIGVALALVDVVSRPVHVAVWEGLSLTVTSLRDITVGISRLLWDAIRFRADFSQVAGPVGIVGLVGEASSFGITSLLMFTAFISLNLAVINVLPFPALDGGRLLFVGVEAVKGSPIKPKYVHALNTLGFALLILLMVAVTYNDISRII